MLTKDAVMDIKFLARHRLCIRGIVRKLRISCKTVRRRVEGAAPVRISPGDGATLGDHGDVL